MKHGKEKLMNVEIVFKIAGIGMITAVVNSLLTRSGRDDIAALSTLAGLIITLIMMIDMVAELFQKVKNVFGLF